MTRCPGRSIRATSGNDGDDDNNHNNCDGYDEHFNGYNYNDGVVGVQSSPSEQPQDGVIRFTIIKMMSRKHHSALEVVVSAPRRRKRL